MDTRDETTSRERWEVPEDRSEKSAQGGYHPWRRFFARTLDLFFISFIFMMLFVSIGAIFFPRAINGLLHTLGNPLISGIVVYLFWVPIEAFFLSTRGATPGKWLFGITVLTQSGERLSYPDALQRAFLVWIKGDGLGIPIVAVVTRIFAYKRLNRTGTTLWDSAMGSVVTHREFSMVRTIACVFAVSVALGASAILGFAGSP